MSKNRILKKNLSHKNQLSIMKEIHKNSKLVYDESASAISASWYNSWKYGFYEEKAREIDNSSIECHGKLKPNLSNIHDYVIVTKLEWNQLHEWFGRGPIIKLEVICHPTTKQPYVIVKYPIISLSYQNERKNKVIQDFILVSSLIQKARDLFSIPENQEIRLIDFNGEKFNEEMKPKELLKR
jgi:hypothetical protein